MSARPVVVTAIAFGLALSGSGTLTASSAQHADEAALLRAASEGRVGDVSTLLDQGVDLNARDDDDWTPLLFAAQGGNAEVVSLLLGRGADVSASNRAGWTPLMAAALNGHTEVANMLLEGGADVNARNTEGWTPLMIAARWGNTEVVVLLLEGGADVNAVDENGATALALAAGGGHSRIVEVLGEAGAAPVPPAQALSDGDTAPFRGFGFLGSIIIILVCVMQRKKEIGGWLLYYYIQIYLGLFVTLVMVAVGIENYLPATWAGASGLYVLFLLSTVPGVLLTPAQVVAAERLRLSRMYDRLGTLRLVLWLELAAAILALAIDLLFFTESLVFSVLGLLWPTIWLPYFYRSRRVDRVFRTRDWLPVLHPEPAA